MILNLKKIETIVCLLKSKDAMTVIDSCQLKNV